MSASTAQLTELIISQRRKFPINEDDLEWTVHQIPATSRHKSMRGHYEVSVRCPNTEFAGWAIRKTEQAARDQALIRLYYARDYGL